VSELTPLDLTPQLRPEREALLELLRGLAPSDWERPTECAAWNVKGITLHILGDDLSLVSRQRDASTDSLTLFAANHPGLQFRQLLDGFNEQWVTAATFLSTELVIELLRVVGEWSDTFYGEVGLDAVAREPVGFFAADAPSPYWQLIAREYVERVVHQSQIRRAVGAPELQGPLLTGAARVVVHAMAAWFRDYAPERGSRIGIDFGRADAWTWQREPDRWSVSEGADASSHALIRVEPELTAAFVSRGLAANEVASALVITGDEVLARRALDIVIPLVGIS
jgi:uncharacterized protein (TIGR03083 family)